MLRRAIHSETFVLATDPAEPHHFWTRRPTRLSIDASGVRVDYGPSKSRILSWDDPGLQFALLDYREAPRNRPPWVRRPKQFEFRFRPELGTSGFAIPERAYRALSAAAPAAGLLLGPAITGGGIPAGTKVHIYARRPRRWWSRAQGRSRGDHAD
jgi:hypothetical protein